MTAPMVSSLLLYYGNGGWYDGTLRAHWIVGAAAFAAFPLYLALGHRTNVRATRRHDSVPKNLPPRHDARDNAGSAGEPGHTFSAQES